MVRHPRIMRLMLVTAGPRTVIRVVLVSLYLWWAGFPA